MLEIPEANVIAAQLDRTVKGKKIKEAVAATSPHKFAWYYGDPADYGSRLRGRELGTVAAYGGRVEIDAEEAVLNFADGASPRYYAPGESPPEKHQLLITFEDGSALAVTVAMYGGVWAFPKGGMDDNPYFLAAKQAVPVLSATFDRDYFLGLLDEKALKLSAKAFLATEQRIPGLGNGVLQDILLNAGIHPKKKMNTLSNEQLLEMFTSVKSTLAEMTESGGRDTERDIFGVAGGYKTKLSRSNTSLICPDCGGDVTKQSYLGGSIYFCGNCQPV